LRPGLVVELELPGLRETVLVINGAEEGKQLAAQGVPRGRIWTTREVTALRANVADRAHALAVAEAKVVFDGRVDEAIKRNAPTA
jgi:hypothetical protein